MSNQGGGGESVVINFENDANSINAWKGMDQEELEIDTTKKVELTSSAQKMIPSKSSSVARSTRPPRGDDDKMEDEMDYVPKWARSSKQAATKNDEDERSDNDTSEQFSPTEDELPPFADEASIALHREIKLLEQRRDQAASSTRSHKERTDIINDHLRSIRQEIDHTNSLVAAKKSEVDTEEHLLSISQRELGQSLRDTSSLESGNATIQQKIKSAQSQIKVAEEELETLRTDLNWNQEELEQWATAATKKEEESLALQKYKLADELKIKELTSTIEDLTKLSVDKKSLLENEVIETKSNQTELEKLAERFKNRHDERRQLLQQWKDTIESMNNRDQAINELAGQYAEFAQKEDATKKSMYMNREQFEFLENERDDSQQDVDDKERHLQTKRQDLSSLQDAENSLKDEVGSLQTESSMVVSSVENKRAERKRAQNGLDEKKEQVGLLSKQLEDVKSKLANEKLDTNSKERLAETIEKTLAGREKELQQAEKDITSLKNKMYKDSLRLADLRKKEADLIADIHGAQANIKNFTSKVNELENKRTKQQELLYNADFQLQQMEKKVARGLGERSTEEQEKLQVKIEALGKELESEKQKKLLLVQQQRKLQAELRAWSRKYELSDSKYNETMQKIDGIGLEIFACEQSLKDMVSKKEEAMVSHDVTLLDVRRLRDSLRKLLEDVHFVKHQYVESSATMKVKREEAAKANEVKSALLRTCKDERHKAAIDLGKLKVALEKTKAKYDMISAVNAGKGGGEGFESPELKLILAAQRREELQQEGDKLDDTIQKKEKEIRTMKRTLAQLRERNTNFRSSFKKADIEEQNELRSLEAKAEVAQEALFRVRSELQQLHQTMKNDKLELEGMKIQLESHEKRNEELLSSKEQFLNEVVDASSNLDLVAGRVSTMKSNDNNPSRGELQYRAFNAEIIQIQVDRIQKLLTNLADEFPELSTDIRSDLKRMGLS